MAKKPIQTPTVHSKNAATGKGIVPKTPGNADSVGPSNHEPKVGAGALYSSEQQQQ